MTSNAEQRQGRTSGRGQLEEYVRCGTACSFCSCSSSVDATVQQRERKARASACASVGSRTRDGITRRAWMPERVIASVVIVLTRMAECQDRNMARIHDLEAADVAGAAEWNEQFPQQRVLPRLAASVGRWRHRRAAPRGPALAGERSPASRARSRSRMGSNRRSRSTFLRRVRRAV